MSLQCASRRRCLAAMIALGLEPVSPAVRAQARARRLAVLNADPPSEEMEQFLLRLRDFGWIEGRNLVIERGKSASDEAATTVAVRAMVDRKPDVLLMAGTSAALTAGKATATIPIVFSMGMDPVAAGLAKSLAHPGGNATGVYNSLPLLEAKRLSHLRELMPGLSRVAVLHDSRNLYWDLTRESREAAYRSFGLTPEYIDVESAAAIEAAVDASARRRAQAILIESEGFWYRHRLLLINAANRHRLPVIAADDEIAKAGALLSLARDEDESDRALLNYIDKILRGARPGDLPVQEPHKFVFALNLATAKTLGINVPQGLLLRADRRYP
jgi:putative ABC transport system substrate-binding protein